MVIRFIYIYIYMAALSSTILAGHVKYIQTESVCKTVNVIKLINSRRVLIATEL